MALTAEDVINKRFQPTKFREGYDQDEVDDFLDEVVVELRRLHQENDTLRKQVETLGGRPEDAPAETSVSEPGTGAGQATTVAAATSRDSREETVSEPVAAAPAETTAPAEPKTTGTGTSGTDSAPSATAARPVAEGTASTDSTQSAAAVLAMAQKLHDDYVSQGQSERERLITEGRTQADHLVAEGKRTKEETLSALEAEKVDLEAAVAELRTFESDYRGNLKSFLNTQLKDLDNTGSLAPSQASGTKRTAK